MFKNRLTDDEKYMLAQNQLERELTSLKRQFFSLDLDKFYAKKGNKELLRTSKVLAIFLKEKINLLNDLTRAKDPGRVKEDEKIFNKLSDQLQDFNVLEAQVMTQKIYILEIEKEIKQYKKSVEKFREQQVTDKQLEDRLVEARHTLEGLENKLETQMIKFGTICSKNRVLREEIEHLLCERRSFVKVFDRFIKKLTEGKKIMLDLIEQATIAFNQREEWCNKLQGLRQRAHHELLQNRQTMQNYKRKQDHTKKLTEFFDTKGQKRILEDLQRKYKEKKQRQREQLQKSLEVYKQMMNDIREFTQEENVDRIARNYLNQEEINFSNFRYVIDCIEDMDLMNEELGPLHLDIEDRTILHHVRERAQKQKLAGLEEMVEDAGAETHDSEEKLAQLTTTLSRLSHGVETLFTLCRCDRDPLLQLLGDQSHITNHNILLYLNVLEDRVHRLLVEGNYKDKISEKKKALVSSIRPKIYSVDKIVQTTPCALCVEHEFVSDVVDTLQNVFTRKKAKDKLRMRLKFFAYPCHNISNCQLPKSRQMMQKRYE